MAVDITLQDQNAILTIHGIDKLFTFTGQLIIPLEHISAVSRAPEISRKEIGIKLVGAGIPGLLRAGTYSGQDGLAFWDVHDYDKALMFELHDERYARLFVEVKDPDQTLARIQQALDARG